MAWWVTAYWILAGPVVVMAVLITAHTVEHRRFVRSRISHPRETQNPGRVALFVPCKGAEADLDDNLRPMFEQDHGDYSLTLIVESRDDTACPAILRLIAQHPQCDARILVAGVCSDGGQKVHNLLAATSQLQDTVATIAFADSDIRPPRNWLRRLTQHLDHRGVATGYRCFIPKRNTMANLLLCGINSATTGMMFPGRHHIVWGGSWAIRREVFERGRFREAWKGTLSDDMMATRVLARIRERVSFEPACVVASTLDTDLKSMASFVRRQLAIGRCCAPLVWTGAMALFSSTQIVFWGSLTAVAYGLASGASWTWQPAIVAGLLYALSSTRAWLRQSASRAFLPDHQQALAVAHRFDFWLSPLAGLTTFLGLVASAVGRRIVWRGVQYEMHVGGRAIRLTQPTTTASAGPAMPATPSRKQAA